MKRITIILFMSARFKGPVWYFGDFMLKKAYQTIHSDLFWDP